MKTKRRFLAVALVAVMMVSALSRENPDFKNVVKK